MDIGGDLCRARTARQLTLAEITHRTKINGSLLRAIEDNRFDLVPGGLFTRGYLRAYAREVQLDPESLIAQYRSEFETPAQTEPSAEESPSVVDVGSLAMDAGEGRSHAAGLVVVLLIGFVYFAFARSINTESTSAEPKPTDAIQEASARQPVPTSTGGTLDTRPSAPLNLVIQTTGNCWVDANVDGEPVFAHLMSAGGRLQYDVREQVTIRVGDPAAFTFTLDGIPGRVLGPAGTPVNLKFNRENYKEVLQEKPQ